MKRRKWLAGCTLMALSGSVGFTKRTALAATAPGLSADEKSTTQYLPLFPLDLVAFPDETVFLRIFEPRYKQLISESAGSGNTFGIVTLVAQGAANVGTEMQLDRILRTDATGNMDIATRGLRVFRMERIQRPAEGKLYSGARVAFISNDSRIEPQSQSELVQLFNRMQDRARSRPKLSAPYPENLSFLIGHDVGLSQAQKLQLLTLPVEHERQLYLVQHLLQMQ